MATHAALVERLKASGGTESVGFLNDLVAHLWPNINVAGCRMVKEIVEPMFASMLPGPLSSLRFVKLDLGPVPLEVSEVDVHKVDNGSIKLDMDVTWEGKSDIELDGNMVPKMGIEHVHLKGRLSILLGPLTNIMPLIGAAQIAFINPPELRLDFTNALNIADWAIVDKVVRKAILDIICSMAVLPNRYLVKLDNNNDYFRTYLPHLGALRLTIEGAQGISNGGPKKTGVKRLLQKIVKDVPDCYCKVMVGADEWRTSTKDNTHDPTWNETHDFLIADHDQRILLDIQDDDLGADDDIGVATTDVKSLLLAHGTQTLDLFHKGEATPAKITLRATYLNFVSDANILTGTSTESADQIVGLATILVASALGLQGQRDELKPSIKVNWAGQEFRTAAKSYIPGTDIFNPSFDQAFRIPITAALVANPANFKIALMNGTSETGSIEVPFQDVLNAPGLSKEESFDVGSGATVRASITLRGLQATQ